MSIKPITDKCPGCFRIRIYQRFHNLYKILFRPYRIQVRGLPHGLTQHRRNQSGWSCRGVYIQTSFSHTALEGVVYQDINAPVPVCLSFHRLRLHATLSGKVLAHCGISRIFHLLSAQKNPDLPSILWNGASNRFYALCGCKFTSSAPVAAQRHSLQQKPAPVNH